MMRIGSNLISAFTEENVERLTGLTVHQLRRWDRTGFFVPSLAYEDRSQAHSRLYSFRDVVALKVLNALRNESKVSLPHLRKVKNELLNLGENWSSTTLYVLSRKVVFFNSQTQSREEIVSGQGVLAIPLQVVTGDMEQQVRDMKRRDQKAAGKVEKRHGFGRPVVAGTRIPVANIKAFATAGYSIEKIMREYPTLTRNDVEAAINFDQAA